MSDGSRLAGKLLVSMPGMGDPRFAHSVVLVCAHDEESAMGLIINKPSAELNERQLMSHAEIEIAPGQPDRPVYFGGPVGTSHGFVLHSGAYGIESHTMRVTDEIAMTATLDILRAIGGGTGPDAHILALGYSGWGPGQLESEIVQNGWLVVDADTSLVFGTENDRKWEQALAHIGVDPRTLSARAGTA